MTRDEVARECERLGWELEDVTGVDENYAPVPYYVVLEGRRIVAGHDTPREAYLEACAREGLSPF